MNKLTEEQYRFYRSETGIAARLIKRGLTDLATCHAQDTSVLGPILFDLSLGLERFFKILWILLTLEQRGGLPTNQDLKAVGHDILALAVRVQQMFGTKVDKKLVEAEPYRNILDSLSKFARGSRYYNLDSMTGGTPESPFLDWKANVEDRVFALHFSEERLAPAAEMGRRLDRVSLSRWTFYDGSTTRSCEAAYPAAEKTRLSNREIKVYIAHIIRGFALFRDMHHLGVYYLCEFFPFFECEDSYIRKRKTIV